MKRYHRLAIGAAASVGIALATATAFAQTGPMNGGMGSMMGMHGKMSPMHSGSDGDHKAGQQLMTPQEREALHEKMRNAKTPEERQVLAATTRAEMGKRAKEKGIATPKHGSMAHMGKGMGMHGGGLADGEHKH